MGEEDVMDLNVSTEDLQHRSPHPPGDDGELISPPDLTEMKLASSSSSSSSSSSPPLMDTLLIGTVPSAPLLSSQSPLLSSQSPLLSSQSPLLSSQPPLLSSQSPLLSSQPPLLSSQSPLLSHHHRIKTLTEEQEFAEGFVKALEDLHKQNQLSLRPLPGPLPHSSVDPSPPVTSVLPDLPDLPDPVYTSLNSYASSSALVDTMVPFLPPHPHHHHHHHHHHLTAMTDEPQTVPDVQSMCSGDTPSPPPAPPPHPPLSPVVTVEVQERTVSKAERKRLRNRIAATKCRRRKLERISRLEVKVQSLREQNTDLSSTASLLRNQVDQLKQRVVHHADSGCQVTAC